MTHVKGFEMKKIIDGIKGLIDDLKSLFTPKLIPIPITIKNRPRLK